MAQSDSPCHWNEQERRGEVSTRTKARDLISLKESTKSGVCFLGKIKREIARYSTTRDRTTPKASATERPTNTIASVTALHDNVPCFSRNPKWQKSNSCPCTSRPDPNARCSLESPRDLCTWSSGSSTSTFSGCTNRRYLRRRWSLFRWMFRRNVRFCDAFRKKKNALSFKKEKKREFKDSNSKFFSKRKKGAPAPLNRQSTPDEKKKVKFGPRKRHCSP